MLRAFYVETKVDQGGVWFSEGVFISLLFLLLQNPRPRRKSLPTPASINSVALHNSFPTLVHPARRLTTPTAWHIT